MEKINCKDNKHCWINMRNIKNGILSDHSDCENCCECGESFVNLYHNKTIEIPRVENTKPKYSNYIGIKKIIVYEVHVNEGSGTTDDPIYREIYYVKENGDVIGKQSPNPFRQFSNDKPE